MLDYDYIKNHYRLIAVELSGQKDLNGDPNAVHQIEFVGQLKNMDGVYADGFLTTLEKIKEARLKVSQGTVKVSYELWRSNS